MSDSSDGVNYLRFEHGRATLRRLIFIMHRQMLESSFQCPGRHDDLGLDLL